MSRNERKLQDMCPRGWLFTYYSYASCPLDGVSSLTIHRELSPQKLGPTFSCQIGLGCSVYPPGTFKARLQTSSFTYLIRASACGRSCRTYLIPLVAIHVSAAEHGRGSPSEAQGSSSRCAKIRNESSSIGKVQADSELLV